MISLQNNVMPFLSPVWIDGDKYREHGTTAHKVKVITVHWGSAGCLQPTPSSEWFLKGPHLISPFTQWAACSRHLLLSDSSKPSPYFTVLSVKCKWSRIQSKKILYTSGFSQKNLVCCPICFINFACGAIFSSNFLRQFVSDSQFPCRK